MGYSGQDPRERVFENDHGPSIKCQNGIDWCCGCKECLSDEEMKEYIKQQELEYKRRRLLNKPKIRWLQTFQTSLYYSLTGFPKRKHMTPGEEITWRSKEEYIGLI